MSLCNLCKAIPMRKYLRGSGGTYGQHFHKSHPCIADIVASGNSCTLCNVVGRAIQHSFWAKHIMQDTDRNRQVWLKVRASSMAPAIHLLLGDKEPETQIFGMDLYIHVAASDPMADIISWRYVHESPLHPEALQQADKWLKECFDTHTQCAQVTKQEQQLPTRLLDLSALPGRETMANNKSWRGLFEHQQCKLVEHTSGERGYYVALSYCWGKSLAYKTVKANKESHMQGIDFQLLPKTLQDAVMVSRYHNLQYIWIDCLCIVQDDSLDWQREAAKMADVYSNAFLTIAADRAPDSATGFLGPRSTEKFGKVSFEDEEGPYTIYFRESDVSAEPGSVGSVSMEPLRDEPLSTRVWTLQERILAQRTLHYGKDQMYWECNHSSNVEDGDNFGAGAEDFRLLDIVEELRNTSITASRLHWYKLVQAFTARNMTYPTDKLPALSGVIASIQRQTGDEYYAGIWKRHFIEDLLWKLEDPQADIYVLRPKTPSRPTKWRSPSWSFAALEGVVRYQEFGSSGGDMCATLKECSVTPSGLNPLGELKDGFAVVEGPVTTADQVGHGKTVNGLQCRVWLRDEEHVSGAIYFDIDEYEDVEVLMITPYAGIALHPVAEDRYVRVGVVQVWTVPGALLSAGRYPSPRTITLI